MTTGGNFWIYHPPWPRSLCRGGTIGQDCHMSMVSGYCAPVLSETRVPRHSSCWLGSQRLHIPAYLGIGSQKILPWPFYPPPPQNSAYPSPSYGDIGFIQWPKILTVLPLPNPPSLQQRSRSSFLLINLPLLPFLLPIIPPTYPPYHSIPQPTSFIIPHTGIIPWILARLLPSSALSERGNWNHWTCSSLCSFLPSGPLTDRKAVRFLLG